MFSARPILAAAALALLAPAAPALAGTVVAASGPSAGQYPVGSQIADTQSVTLRAGDVLTVLDRAGTRVLRGPGSFVLARGSAAARNQAFSALTTQRTARRARTGAVRDPRSGDAVRNPNLWYVDIAAGGTVCLTDPANIAFWRGDTAEAASYRITPAGGPAQDLAFAAREMLASWAGPVAQGSEITVEAPNGTRTQLRFALLAEVPEEPEALAQALISQGCTAQLDNLANAMIEG